MLTFRLSEFLIKARKGEVGKDNSETREMVELVEQYSAFEAFEALPKTKADVDSQSKFVVSRKTCRCRSKN
jgi:hypothetical protein